MTGLRYLARLPRGNFNLAREHGVTRCNALSDVEQHEAALWASGPSSVLEIADGKALVIGTLVHKGESRTVADVLAAPLQEDRASISRHLIDDYWGAYVALEVSGAGTGYGILRDPSGFLPCYRIDTPSHVILASDLPAMVDGGYVTRGINWDCLFEHLQNPDVRRLQTCIEGVSEVPPGTLGTTAGMPGEETMLWEPWSFFERESIRSTNDEAEALCSVIGTSVSVLAAGYEHVVVGVSGGLDSSILCAALAQYGHRFTCLTMATADPSGDERSYARAVADAVGAPLMAHIYQPERIDLTRSAASHLPRPVGQAFMQEIEGAYQQESEARGADAIFTGNGGDNVFCFLHSAAPVIDRLRTEGLTGGVGRTLLDMCALTECDIPTMARAVLAGLFRGNKPMPVSDRRLLDPAREARTATRRLTPYLEHMSKRSPGERAHVRLLLGIQNFIEGYDRATRPPVLSPLLCQPIVEACLAIPTWHWCEGGINRSVARRAFRGRLPAVVLERTSKAGPDSLMAAVFERGRSILRDQLLGGLLRRERIIDAKAVEAALANPDATRSQLFYRLLALGEAEAWARSWLNRLPSAAGARP